MAHKLTLQNSPNMPFIWNITQHVGDAPSCQNLPNDVLLTKILIGEWLRVAQPNINAACREPFEVSAGMNIRVAYWIRAVNEAHTTAGTGAAASMGWAAKGILSPARGASFGNGNQWTIFRLNMALFERARPVWDNLPNHPNCSGALAQELANTV